MALAPVCYNAPWGKAQPRAAIGAAPERVLHLCIANGRQPQIGQEQSLRRFGPYRRVDWLLTWAEKGLAGMHADILAAAAELHPTLVWAQVQQPGILSVDFLKQLRALCDPAAILVLWTGDTVDYQDPTHPAKIAHGLQPWIRELAPGLDLFTASTMDYCEEMVATGGCSAGFMQCGYDTTQFDLRHPRRDVPWASKAVWTAHHYPTLEEESRTAIAQFIGQALPGTLHVWGAHWPEIPGVVLHEPVSFEETCQLYADAAIVVSTSCTNALRRYTSGRLQRILGSGGVCAVQYFVDMGGMGLIKDVNCFIWDNPAQLADLIEMCRAVDATDVRSAGYNLARSTMTWDAAYAEMLYMVRAERARRAAVVP